MPKHLPDIPAGSTIRQNADGSWQYQRRNVGPWLPMPDPQGAAPWADGPAVSKNREPASIGGSIPIGTMATMTTHQISESE
jgi:hypothetical protein